VLYIVRYGFLRRTDHSSRGVLPTVVRRGVRSRNLKNEEATVRVGPQSHREKNHRESRRRSHYQVQYVGDEGTSNLRPAYRSKCQRSVTKRENLAFIARRWQSLPDTISRQTILIVFD